MLNFNLIQIGEFMTFQQGANLYTQGFGSRPENVEVPHVELRSPTSNDTGGGFFTIGKIWVRPDTNSVWMLTFLVTISGVTTATWTPLAAGSSGIQTLSAEGGSATLPLANNFDFRGNSGGVMGAIQFSTPSNGEMNANVRVDGVTVTINGSNQLEAVNGYIWSIITGNIMAQKGHGYFADAPIGPLGLTVTLPNASVIGDSFRVYDIIGNGFVIAQGAGQSIQVGQQTTTVGAGGSIGTLKIGDTVELVCSVANTQWEAVDYDGNLFIT